jgi:hypothetical protein
LNAFNTVQLLSGTAPLMSQHRVALVNLSFLHVTKCYSAHACADWVWPPRQLEHLFPLDYTCDERET